VNRPDIKVVDAHDWVEVPDSVLCSAEPVVLRGLVSQWPAVAGQAQDPDAALEALLKCYSGRPVSTFLGEAEINGRFFYNEDLTGFNFLQLEARLDDVIHKLKEQRSDRGAPAIYVGSTNLDAWLPGFRSKNDLPLDTLDPIASLWIGNQTRVAPHFDLPQNIACCVMGRRRFTLFPPEQIANLYIGPLDLTPAGQPISLVDFNAVDLERFPKAQLALDHAVVADLEPGDALLVPSMWWHQVEALDDINILVNYWWSSVPEFLGAPGDALLHAMLSIRSLPKTQREIWRRFFDYYIFDADESTHQHIPEAARGRLGSMDDTRAKRMRALLLNQLKR
jgi:hypothetical protein